MADAIPVILDTDIGSDIDDAFSLAYLLRQPRCELLGITTVTGEVEKRAALAHFLCQAAGRPDVPIHCGARGVLKDGPGQPNVPHYDAIRDLDHRLDFPQGTALKFLRDTIVSRPGEVVLLSIGPLTNVALLLALDPEVQPMLRAWVSMAGQYSTPHGEIEWNSRCDPLATAAAFRGRVPRHVHVGLNVTRRCSMAADEVRARLKGPVLEVVASMADLWFEKRDNVVFHDPLAAALVFKPELCGLQKGNVEVDQTTGSMRFEADESGRDEVAVTVDVEGFFSEYFSVFET